MKTTILPLMAILCWTQHVEPVKCFAPLFVTTTTHHIKTNAQQAIHSETQNENITNQTTTFPQSLRAMYPLPELRNNGTIKLDDTHEMYYEEYGPPSSDDDNNDSSSNSKLHPSKVALSLHGGPGAGSFPNHSRFFNTSIYNRIILYDQRGCGKSQPRGETQGNTLEDLVLDIETLRIHLGIHKWDAILGGSWGSTLALAYAQSFPNRVGGIVLRGICLFRNQEIEWLFGDDIGQHSGDVSVGGGTGDNTQTRPCLAQVKSISEQWQTFQGIYKDVLSKNGGYTLQENEGRRSTLLRYYDYLHSGNAWDRIIAAKYWMTWEMTVSRLTSTVDEKLNSLIDGNNQTIFVSPSKATSWSIIKHDESISAEKSSIDTSNFRRWQKELRTVEPHAKDQTIRPFGIRPNLPRNENKQLTKYSNEEIEKMIPAQAMLTCFYSINNEFMMNKFDLLSPEAIERIRNIPCIGIQGGMDSICPPDSALDLKDAWPEMELRIVTTGKHSQYDPQITSELIRATNRIAMM